jgi:GT2 family glycosyltransferase
MLNISVIIPTYNRLDRLKMVLSALELQTCPQDEFEVVVVSDGCTDGTDTFLQSWQTSLNLIPVFQDNQGAAAARNFGVEEARGELILFVDDDVVPEPDLIRTHINAHQAYSEEMVVIGAMLTPPDFKLDPWSRWLQERLAEQYADMIAGEWEPTARQFYTGNASIKRRFLLEYGGFDARFMRAEDVELAYRLADHGLHFVFEPDAIGYHYEQRSFASWIKIPYAYGRNDVLMARQKNQPWLLDTICREYRERHGLIRGLTWICLDRAVLGELTIGLFHWLALGADWLNLHFLSRVACSVMFNVRNYQGVADELGGRMAFYNEIVALNEVEKTS